MILVLSVAVIDGLERFLDNAAQQLRLAVTQKASIVNNLPFGHRRKIEALDPTRERIRSVCAILWIGGTVDNSSTYLSTLAADPDTFVETFPEYGLTAEQIERWNSDKAAIILGSFTAQQFNWSVGDRVTIRPSVPPYIPMEFHVISTAPGAPDPNSNWIRRDYWEDTIKGSGAIEGYINFFFVKCGSKADVDHYTTAIDAVFAGTTDETKTQDEKTFMNDFITQQFNLPRNLKILAAVTIFVAVMAAANTMSMNFRDRLNEYATLRAMGFGGGTIFGLVQSEAMLLCGIGGVLGGAIPYVAFMHTPLKSVPIPVIVSMEIRPEICAVGIAISIAIGLAAAAWPGVQALRLKVVTALRSLE